jgi:hypothetical protein
MSAPRNKTFRGRKAFLDASNVASARTVEFTPAEALTSGSGQKALQAIRLVKSIFRQKFRCIVMQRSASVAITCPEASEAEILQICAVAEQKLSRLRQESLTAKMVEEILSITGAERRRWTKDGRIPNTGRASFSQGNKQVSLFLYAPDVIRALARDPEQIAEWRRDDGELSPSPQRSSPSPLIDR